MKTIRNIILILITGIVVGYLLLVAVYALPMDWTGPEHDETVAFLKTEKMYLLDRWSYRRLDNFSDSIIMLMASYKGDEGPWRQAASNYYISYGGDDFYKLTSYPYDWLIGRYDETAQPIKMNYGRYWHGYIVPMRLLMMFLSYPQIRVLNFITLTALMILTLVSIYKRLPRTVLPFLLMLLYIAPTAVGKCIEFSGDIYTMLMASLIMLHCNEQQLAGRRIRYFFLIVGIVTPYIGFFTSPTLTLTVPFILMCQLRRNENNMFRLAVECIIFWGIGYVGMWGAKWVIAAISEGREFWKVLFGAQKLRASVKGASRFTGLMLCFKEMLKIYYLNIFLISFIILSIYIIILDRQIIRRKDIIYNLLYLFPILIVFAWYVFFSNHVHIHSWFTYRHACVFILSILVMLNLTGDTPVKKENREC